MLIQLTINNFAIVRKLEIDFYPGMSAITGETGAGKSIAIDALGLCLGNRADTNIVRPGASRSDICAHFSLTDTPTAQDWLKNYQLDNHNECLLRRIITADGRSRGFINGTAVPLSQLRELGTLLIQIHGHYAHQLLLDNQHQKYLLDTYANQTAILAEMKSAWKNWHQSCQELTKFQQQAAERLSRQQLIEYHLKELDELKPQADEYQKLEQEYKQLANREQFLSTSQNALQILNDNEEQNIISMLNHVKQEINELTSVSNQFSHLLDMLEEASIQIHEVSNELRHYGDRTELDPSQLFELEQRIAKYVNLARKHRVAPELLFELHQQLLAEQEKLNQQQDDCDHLTTQVEGHHQYALEIASKLHQIRQQYASELSQLITNSMHQLSMPHGYFTVDVNFNPEHLQIDGASQVEFNVTTNPGQPHQALIKVASGGELSRIALAIQVITAKKMDTPALIFDEVDVGISGPTAAVVGKLLRELGNSTQVMCVTHLPQVAACGHHHFYVSKQTNGCETETQMQLLDKKNRLQEIARLLGGSEVTKNILASAKDLLAA